MHSAAFGTQQTHGERSWFHVSIFSKGENFIFFTWSLQLGAIIIYKFHRWLDKNHFFCNRCVCLFDCCCECVVSSKSVKRIRFLWKMNTNTALMIYGAGTSKSVWAFERHEIWMQESSHGSSYGNGLDSIRFKILFLSHRDLSFDADFAAVVFSFAHRRLPMWNSFFRGLHSNIIIVGNVLLARHSHTLTFFNY